MLLKIRRSQRSTLIKGTAVFIIDARVVLTAAENSNVNRYSLHKEVVYNSAASRRHLDSADASLDGSAKGLARGLTHAIMARMNLNISIGSLIGGTHVECKDLGELMGAEEAILAACENLKSYLDTAATFDGREILVEFDAGKPKVVDAPTPQITVDRTDIPPLPPADHVIEAEFVDAPQIAQANDAPVAKEPFEDFMNWWKARSTNQILMMLGGLVLVTALAIAAYNLLKRPKEYVNPCPPGTMPYTQDGQTTCA
jgi:hypothetical protein